jgi:hypothetical protein
LREREAEAKACGAIRVSGKYYVVGGAKRTCDFMRRWSHRSSHSSSIARRIESEPGRGMAGAELNRRVGKVVGYPPLSEMGVEQRREFREALLEADSFEDLPGKWQAAIVTAEQNRPNLRVHDRG